MGCCGNKNINIPKSEQKIVNKINTIVKSNRSPRGTIAKQCLNCGTKTIANTCPVCFFPVK